MKASNHARSIIPFLTPGIHHYFSTLYGLSCQGVNMTNKSYKNKTVLATVFSSIL